ncbi:hypothetical protein [Aerobium aerolatum]|uniref:hypothetical protein n=1 Tax=Aerobium aerolatum TaxID=561088 RepID=UPI001113E011|nr:hypothetical protein [Aquamicrobium aerolatum]
MFIPAVLSGGIKEKPDSHRLKTEIWRGAKQVPTYYGKAEYVKFRADKLRFCIFPLSRVDPLALLERNFYDHESPCRH